MQRMKCDQDGDTYLSERIAGAGARKKKCF